MPSEYFAVYLFIQFSKVADLREKQTEPIRNRTGWELMRVQCGDSLLVEATGRKATGPDYIHKQIHKDFAKVLEVQCVLKRIYYFRI